MEFSNARSAKSSPLLSSSPLILSFLRSSELSFIIDSIQSHSFVRRKIAALAVSSEKLASSTVSPASANANLTASAPNSSIAWPKVLKFPVDLLILSPFNNKWPLHRNALGHLFS